MPSSRTAAITVIEGSHHLLVGYPDWDAWRRERSGGALPQAPLVPANSASCAMCWGNGRILEEAGNGEGLIPVVCEHCDGWGLV